MSANSAHGSALPFERFAAKVGTPPAPAAGLVRILAGDSLMGDGALRGTTAMGSETVKRAPRDNRIDYGLLDPLSLARHKGPEKSEISLMSMDL